MKVKQLLKAVKTKYQYLVAVINMTLVSAMTVYASDTDLEDTKLVTGTKDLLTAFTAVITGLVFIIVSALAIKQIVVIMTSNDQEKAGAKKTLWHIIGWGVVGVTIPGVLTVIFAFYR